MLENAQPCTHSLVPVGPPPSACQSHGADHSCGRSRPCGWPLLVICSPCRRGVRALGALRSWGQEGVAWADGSSAGGVQKQGGPLGISFWPSREVAGLGPLPAPPMPRPPGRGPAAGFSGQDDHKSLSGASPQGPCPERCLSPKVTQKPPDPKSSFP